MNHIHLAIQRYKPQQHDPLLCRVMPEYFEKLKPCVRPRKPRNDMIAAIIETVCDYYRVSEERLYEKTRKHEVVKARQIAMYLLSTMARVGCTELGKMFGFDHTTGIHSVKTVRDLIDAYNDYANEINEIKTKIA